MRIGFTGTREGMALDYVLKLGRKMSNRCKANAPWLYGAGQYSELMPKLPKRRGIKRANRIRWIDELTKKHQDAKLQEK